MIELEYIRPVIIYKTRIASFLFFHNPDMDQKNFAVIFFCLDPDTIEGLDNEKNIKYSNS